MPGGLSTVTFVSLPSTRTQEISLQNVNTTKLGNPYSTPLSSPRDFIQLNVDANKNPMAYYQSTGLLTRDLLPISQTPKDF